MAAIERCSNFLLFPSPTSVCTPTRSPWIIGRMSLCMLVFFISAAFPALANAASPSVTIEAATELTSEKATLNATVNPNGIETTYRFEYGLTTSYGTNVPIPDGAIGSGSSNVKVSQTISGLVPSTTYHFRVVFFCVSPGRHSQ